MGIIVSTLIAVSASGSRWLIGAAVVLAAVSIVGADALDGWRRRRSLAPSVQGVVAAAALLVACGIVAIRDFELVAMLIPVLGGGTASAVLFKGQSCVCARREP
jgi:hypothetical protein